MDDQTNDKTEVAPEPDSKVSVYSASGTTRRRFTRASLGAAPVAMALVNRPVFAQGGGSSPSGFESANVSNPATV